MLEKFGRFDEALIKKFIKQIVLGLVYLHSQGIVHRDIKVDKNANDMKISKRFNKFIKIV